MYFLIFDCLPAPHNPDRETIGGAFISCWIKCETLDIAEAAARRQIETADWEIIEMTESRIVDRDDYSEDEIGRQYYEYAETDGGVLVAHMYPPTNT